ncbi:MAG: FHA domain-containing protein [Propionibacteriaceae bacterium]|jgi:pSer/pThr/pTyr-binding forkhead associated (FHA) protein|nr:FHA domain-containing protein [Propionibacteriaceae bacterium]
MKCPVCGHDVGEDANFCPHCGASLDKTSGETTKDIPIADELFMDDLGEEAQNAVDVLPEGAAMLMVVRGSQAGERFLLADDVTVAGRHPRCDVFLDDITVSRHHARFTKRDGYVWVSDENSLNGTYVNQTLIDGEVALRRGDTVQIGKFRMIFFDNRPGQ